MAYDTIVLGGAICTHDHVFACDIGVTEGKVAAIARPGELRAEDAQRVVDARGCYVMPGLIEILDLGDSYLGDSDDGDVDVEPDVFDHGVLTSLRLITPARDQTLRAAFMAQELARKQSDYVPPSRDVGWHMAITRREHLVEIGSLADLGVTSFALESSELGQSWHREIVPIAREHRVTIVAVVESHEQTEAVAMRALKAVDALILDGLCVLSITQSGQRSTCVASRSGTQVETGMIRRRETPSGVPAAWRTHVHRPTHAPQRDVASMAYLPAHHLGLWGRKGCLLPGFDADLLVVEAGTYTIRHVLLRGQLIPREPSKEAPAPAGIWLHRARLG
jgi:hypothetical protein